MKQAETPAAALENKMNKAKLKQIIKEELTKMLSESDDEIKVQLDQGEFTLKLNVSGREYDHQQSHLLGPDGNVVLHYYTFEDTDGVGPSPEYRNARGQLVHKTDNWGDWKVEMQKAVDKVMG